MPSGRPGARSTVTDGWAVGESAEGAGCIGLRWPYICREPIGNVQPVLEWLTELLAAVLVALAAILAVIAWSASRRFEEARFRYIGLAFLLLSATGALSLIDELTDVFDEEFAVEPGPLLLIVASLGLLYLGLLRARRPREPTPHG